MINSIDIELDNEILTAVKELDSADSFEIKLANILKDFISNQLNDLNSKILTIYKHFIEKGSKTLEFKIEDIDFNSIPLNPYQKKIVDRKISLLTIHADLEKYISGGFIEDDFNKHREEFLNLKILRSDKFKERVGISEEDVKGRNKKNLLLPLELTTEKILEVLSEDEWVSIISLIFILKIKDIREARDLRLKLDELVQKQLVENRIKGNKKLWKLKK